MNSSGDLHDGFDDDRDRFDGDHDLVAVRSLGAALTVDPAVLARVRARIVAADDASPRPAAPGSAAIPLNGRARRAGSRPPAARFRRRVFLGAAATVLAIGLTLPAVLPHGAATAEATEVLKASARAAQDNPDPVVRPDQYLKITSVNLWASGAPDTGMWQDKEIITVYKPGDPSRDWVMTRSGRAHLKPLNAQGTKVMQRNPPTPPEYHRAKNGDFYGPRMADWQQPTDAWMAGLPRDPDALYQRLEDRARGHGNGLADSMFTYGVDLLRTGQVPYDLRAALFEVMSRIDGVSVTATSTDLEGRIGTALAITGPWDERKELILDQDTGQVLGERTTSGATYAQWLKPGTVMMLTSVTTEVVDSAPSE